MSRLRGWFGQGRSLQDTTLVAPQSDECKTTSTIVEGTTRFQTS